MHYKTKQVKNCLHGKTSIKCFIITLNYLRGDSMENLDNSSYRFAGYKRYTFGVHNYLGKRCSQSHSIMRHIENGYKAVNDVYVTFMESKKMKNAV